MSRFDKLYGLKARFINSMLNMEGNMYRCYWITENPELDYITLWLHKPFSKQFVRTYFLISVVTDDMVTELFDRVIHQEDCSYIGKFYLDYGTRATNARS